MYQVYKLLRAVNRQYPNNGFINNVDVDETNSDLIDEDFRDIINQCIQEIYKDVAIEEVFSFATVPGQNQYVLPEDCDIRDICEVVRTGGRYGGRPIGPIAPIEEIVEGETPPPPPPPPEYYPGWIPNKNFLGANSRRLRWATDAEELSGDRYFNAWDNKRIGIYPTPTSCNEMITIYYKKKPKEVLFAQDDIEIKDEYMPILRDRVLMELAKTGSNPDIDLYNVFAADFNRGLMNAKREKNASLPFYQHVKDNARPANYYRRGPRRRWNRW